MPGLAQVDAQAVGAPFLHDIQPMPQDLYLEQLKMVGATQSSLKSDAKLLREWLAQQPHLPQLGEEYDPWLIRFLIGSKNSLQRAKQYLEKHFTTRALRPEWFLQEPSPALDEVFRLIKVGVLPAVTPEGSRMVMAKYTQELGEDASQMDWSAYFKVYVHMMDILMASHGHPFDVEICVDLKHYTVTLNNTFIANLATFKLLVDVLQGSFPVRFKAVHLLNAPGLVKAVVAMVRPFLKDKLGERIMMHPDSESFRKCVFTEYLPSDYDGGNSKTLSEISDDFYLILKTSMPWFRERQKKLASDESKRVGGANKLDEYGVEGSFRKLAFD